MITICRLTKPSGVLAFPTINDFSPIRTWYGIIAFFNKFEENIIEGEEFFLYNLRHNGSTIIHSTVSFFTLESYIISNYIPLKIDYLGSYIKAIAINQTLTKEIMTKDKSLPTEVIEDDFEPVVVEVVLKPKFAYIIELQTTLTNLPKVVQRQVVTAESKVEALILLVNKVDAIIMESVIAVNIKEKLPLLNQ